MSTPITGTKPADPEHPILDCLAHRWSPRSFAETPVEPGKLRQLFEAARWSASSYNEQPWRFVLATEDQPEAYGRLLGCLLEANQSWSKLAPVLIVTAVSERFTRNDKANRCAEHDLGLAVGNLSAQATALGLALHQMAGIDADHAKTALGIPDGFHAFSAVALGYEGEPARLEEDWQRDAEAAPRERKPCAEFVFGGTFGITSELFKA